MDQAFLRFSIYLLAILGTVDCPIAEVEYADAVDPIYRCADPVYN